MLDLVTMDAEGGLLSLAQSGADQRKSHPQDGEHPMSYFGLIHKVCIYIMLQTGLEMLGQWSHDDE